MLAPIWRSVFLTLLLTVLFYPVYGCASEALPDPPEIGSVLPNFELKDLEGNTHTLEQYRGKIVVLEMASHLCPWSRGADPHLVALANKHAEDGVVVIGIDSHNIATVVEIKKYAEENEKTYTILKDVDNKYADAIGAKVTPEVYVVDKEGKLAYHGAFDNRGKPEEKGENAYVEDAVAALLAGKTPETTRAKTWGCTIKRK